MRPHDTYFLGLNRCWLIPRMHQADTAGQIGQRPAQDGGSRYFEV